MGFIPRTPEDFHRIYIAGAQGFVLGGAVVCAMGAVGLLLALAGVIDARWEQAALFVIGAGLVAIGLTRSDRSR